MPLTEAIKGTVVRLISVDAGQGLRQRLAAMGILPNVTMTILQNEGRGQVIVNVRGTRVVLGRGMSNKMVVSLC